MVQKPIPANAEQEMEMELEFEVRGQLVHEPEGQDWDWVMRDNTRHNQELLESPLKIDPRLMLAEPIVHKFLVRTGGTAKSYPFPLCATHVPYRRLSIQPVFVDARGILAGQPGSVTTLPRNPHLPGGPAVPVRHMISGKGFDLMMRNASNIWKKVCLEFDVLPPKAVASTDYFKLDSYLEAGYFSSSVKPDGKSILVFVADSWNLPGQTRKPGEPAPNSVFRGGGYSFMGGTPSAFVVLVDSLVNVPATGTHSCKNNASGAVNANILAHELGHVVGLNHPGIYSPPSGGLPALFPATKGSVMQPSKVEYCSDNPSKNGRSNAIFMHNPLLRTTGYSCTSAEIDDFIQPWWPIV